MGRRFVCPTGRDRRQTGSTFCANNLRTDHQYVKEVEKELAGEAHVLIIDVYNFGKLAREHRVQLIPTLIFFDSSGKEIFRRMGVWDKDSIVKKLKEGGAS
ncbi:MAG: thioredoxin family protein [Deltaproteobacteria bacterium]|nr:thioredoxin family protein [Deltaproteobacteria bacterium]